MQEPHSDNSNHFGPPDARAQLTEGERDKIQERLSALGGEHIKYVNTKPVLASPYIPSAGDVFEFKPERDGDFPSDGIEHFVRVISPPNTGTGNLKKDMGIRTYSAGRADYYPLRLVIKSENNERKLFIMTKGSGSDTAVRERKSPFCRKIRGTDELEGMASLYDLGQDARNSKLLDSAGIRTRLCLGVWQISKIDYEGKSYAPEEFLGVGFVSKEDDLPGIGVFAVRTPLKIEDMRYILASHKIDQPEIETLIKHLFDITEGDDAPEFIKFHKKHQGLMNKSRITEEQRRDILVGFSLAFASVMGRQAARFEKAKAYKALLKGESSDTINNFTIMAESVDNVGVVWHADIKQITSFQQDLLDFSTLFLEYVVEASQLVEAKKEVVCSFFDGYLSEMVPAWDKSAVNEIKQFLDTEAGNLNTDRIDVARAYWVTKLKFDALSKERNSPVSKSEIGDIIYNLLARIFSDVKYEKTSRFIDDFIKHRNNLNHGDSRTETRVDNY